MERPGCRLGAAKMAVIHNIETVHDNRMTGEDFCESFQATVKAGDLATTPWARQKKRAGLLRPVEREGSTWQTWIELVRGCFPSILVVRSLLSSQTPLHFTKHQVYVPTYPTHTEREVAVIVIGRSDVSFFWR